MPLAMDLPVHLSRFSQETPTATVELPDKLYETILCTVKCPMTRPQLYTRICHVGQTHPCLNDLRGL